ncbi:hypothetical protein B0H13DRAFT_1873246 [Mycena leptocephala]|nr:hypothetical protein B0H13DRAFT_1873246 [Mycena leptocephala]
MYSITIIRMTPGPNSQPQINGRPRRMEAWIIISGILLSVAYGTAHSIVANILGHGILAIAHPATYVPTPRSAVLTPLYGTLIFMAGAFVCIATIIALCAGSPKTTGGLILSMEIFLPIPAGIIANVLGVSILHRHGIHGFHEQLPSLAQASSVGAVGQAVLIGIQG